MERQELKEELQTTLNLIHEAISLETIYIENESYEIDDTLIDRMKYVLAIAESLGKK